jgi:hypothetical protein
MVGCVRMWRPFLSPRAMGIRTMFMTANAKPRQARRQVSEPMATDDEDLPVRYLLYAALFMVVLAAVTVTAFFLFVR